MVTFMHTGRLIYVTMVTIMYIGTLNYVTFESLYLLFIHHQQIMKMNKEILVSFVYILI